MTKLFVTFAYPVNDPNAYEIVDTNMKRDCITDIIELYLQDGTGDSKDENEARDLEVYEIKLSTNCDSITIDSNCGNLGLVAGILMDILSRLHNESETKERK